MANSKTWMRVIFAIMAVVFVLCVVAVPLVLIWALNALFNLNIQYTLTTWFAAVIIILILGWHKIIPMHRYHALYGNSWKGPTEQVRSQRRRHR